MATASLSVDDIADGMRGKCEKLPLTDFGLKILFQWAKASTPISPPQGARAPFLPRSNENLKSIGR